MNRILTLTFLLLGSVAKAQNYYYSSTPERDRIIHLVTSLPEIVDEKRIFEKSHIRMAAYIERIPTKQNKYYYVVIAEDQHDRLMPHQRFLINSKTNGIKYWDILNDKIIPLELWRKHHYKDY
jgi:hypothetical protein